MEIPDYWLEKGNPWELERPEVTYKVRMYGESKKKGDISGGFERAEWVGGDIILARAYDMPISGYNTFNTNNLRLWKSIPYGGYEESMYPDNMDYFSTVEKC